MADVVSSTISVIELGIKAYDAVKSKVNAIKADRDLLVACGNFQAYDKFYATLYEHDEIAKLMGGKVEEELVSKLKDLNLELAEKSESISMLIDVVQSSDSSRGDRKVAIQDVKDTIAGLDASFSALSAWVNRLIKNVCASVQIRNASLIDVKEEDVWEKDYTENILPAMETLRAWHTKYGPYYAVAVFKDDDLRENAVAIMRKLQTFWRVIQKRHEKRLLRSDFFTNGLSWMKRAKEYRLLAEQLDIANWYWKEKNLDNDITDTEGNHYLTGTTDPKLQLQPLDEPDEYKCHPVTGRPIGVLDNGARPGRYRVIQEIELAANLAAEKALPKDSLALARLLKLLGVGGQGISFNADYSLWPPAVVEVLTGKAPSPLPAPRSNAPLDQAGPSLWAAQVATPADDTGAVQDAAAEPMRLD